MKFYLPILPGAEYVSLCDQAYASLGAGMLPLLQEPTVTSIATRLAVSPGQAGI